MSGLNPGTYARVITDSIYRGRRVTTMEVCLHRFVLAEFNTHRVFSRNSASSRAIPLFKQIEKVQGEALAVPVSWPAEKPGMQGGEELDERDSEYAERIWRYAAHGAASYATELGHLGVHKSVANRLLEPFLMHTVVVTSAAWENFFHLRLDTHAQPEIRRAAECMWDAFTMSDPVAMQPGEWHLPYLRDGEIEEITAAGHDPRAISSARCARVSYETHDGIRDFDKDAELYKSLCSNGHVSPLEHVCTPDPDNVKGVMIRQHGFKKPLEMMLELPNYGTLISWHQHRFDIEAGALYQSYS